MTDRTMTGVITHLPIIARPVATADDCFSGFVNAKTSSCRMVMKFLEDQALGSGEIGTISVCPFTTKLQ